jgi:hypothetical protein
MTVMIREPECVMLKRRGADYVEKLIVNMSQQEQLEFWQKRTQAMVVRQEKSRQEKIVTPQNKEKV